MPYHRLKLSYIIFCKVNLLTAVGMGGYNGWVIQAAVHWEQIECDGVTTRYKHKTHATSLQPCFKKIKVIVNIYF